MADALQTIDEVSSRAKTELANVQTPDQLEQFRIKYLGSNGEVKNLMQLLKSAPADQKKLVGQRVNSLKDELPAGFEASKGKVSAAGAPRDALDVTEPRKKPAGGNRPILMKVQDDPTDLFARMGFA